MKEDDHLKHFKIKNICMFILGTILTVATILLLAANLFTPICIIALAIEFLVFILLPVLNFIKENNTK